MIVSIYLRILLCMNPRLLFFLLAVFLSASADAQEQDGTNHVEFLLLEYGFPQSDNFYTARDSVSRRWNIFYKRVGLCIVDEATMDSVNDCNRLVFREIYKKYGEGWDVRFHLEIEQEYDKIVQNEAEKAFSEQLVFVRKQFLGEPRGAIESGDSRILFRGFDNSITPAVSNNNGRPVGLRGTNCTVIGPDSVGEYIVRPGSGKTAELELFLIDKDTIVPVKTVVYSVVNLPDPVLYFGKVRSGDKASIYSRDIEVHFQEGYALSFEFKVLSWTLIYENETYTGIGSSINSAIGLIPKLKVNSSMSVRTTVLGPDGIKRSLEGTWDL